MELTHDMIPTLAPKPLSDWEIAPDWLDDEAEVERAFRYRNARAHAGYEMAVPDDQLESRLAQGIEHFRAALLDLVEEGYGWAVACEAVYRLRLNRETEELLIRAIYDRDAAVFGGDLPRSAQEEFSRRAERQRADIRQMLARAAAFEGTLAEIRALPTARSSTGPRAAKTQRRKASASPSDPPARPRPRLANALRCPCGANAWTRSVGDVVRCLYCGHYPRTPKALDAFNKARAFWTPKWIVVDGGSDYEWQYEKPALPTNERTEEVVSGLPERDCPSACRRFRPKRKNQVYADGARCRKRAQRQRESEEEN